MLYATLGAGLPAEVAQPPPPPVSLARRTVAKPMNWQQPGLVELRGIEPLTSAVPLHRLEQFFAVLRPFVAAKIDF